jgi:hypothetical protein
MFHDFSITQQETTMAEVTAPQAAEIIGMSIQTIHRKVDEGSLPARQQGTINKRVFIDIEDLRRFCRNNGYGFREDLARQLAK